MINIEYCCKWISKNTIQKIPKDNDNRLIISIKFGLICVKSYFIMLTKHKIQQIIHQILQFCSLMMVSYLTYFQMYDKKFQSTATTDKNTEQLGMQKLHNGKHYCIFTKFESEIVRRILVYFI